MRFARWITKAADTHSEYEALTAYCLLLTNANQCYVITYIDCLLDYRFSATCFGSLWAIIEKLQVNKKRNVSKYNTAYINKLIMYLKLQKL